MQKLRQGRNLSRKSSQRKALLRSLAEALFLKEKITTTEAKAKEMRRTAEKLITRAKDKNLSSKRHIAGLFSESLTKKIIDDIAPRYKDRKGGYTRVIKLGPRKSDGARMAIIELVK